MIEHISVIWSFDYDDFYFFNSLMLLNRILSQILMMRRLCLHNWVIAHLVRVGTGLQRWVFQMINIIVNINRNVMPSEEFSNTCTIFQSTAQEPILHLLSFSTCSLVFFFLVSLKWSRIAQCSFVEV